MNNIFWLGKIRLCGAKNNTNQHIWAVGELAVWVVRDDGCTTPKGKKQTESTKTNASFFFPNFFFQYWKEIERKKESIGVLVFCCLLQLLQAFDDIASVDEEIDLVELAMAALVLHQIDDLDDLLCLIACD